MSRFEYNFTRESQFEELRDSNRQLTQENQLLKQSLEELIKVNSQLTESIQQFNNQNNYQQQNNDELEKRFEMLLNQIQKLRRQLEEETQKNGSINKQSQIKDRQTESLVNVLEELIQSFKDIENKYENDIVELQKSNQTNSKNFQNMLKKLEQQFNSKVSTVQALSIQLKRKDEILSNIEEQFGLIEKTASKQGVLKQIVKAESNLDKIRLEEKIDSINKQLEQKDRIIRIYQKLISNLKGKIMQKY